MNVIDLLDRGMSLRPEAPCVVDSNGAFTHSEVKQLSCRLANALRASGVVRAQRIAVFSPNTVPAFVAMVALFRAGAVWLPLAERGTVAEKIEFLAENDCAFIFYDHGVEAEVRQIRAALTTIKGIQRLDGGHLEAFAGGHSTRFSEDQEDYRAGDLAWIKGTGGTTGRPKSVMVPVRAAQALFVSFQLCMPVDGYHVNLVAVPLTHGAGNIALAVLFGGGTNVLIRRPDSHEVFDALRTHGVTTLFLPPTVIYRLLAEPDVKQQDFSALKYLIYGAAPMSAHKLDEAIDVFGPVLAQVWGQTEAPLICTFMAPRDHEVADAAKRPQRLTSCGRASPITTVAVMDDAGKLLADGERGELVIRGDLVMAGYLNRPEETQEATRYGWHHTGDIGYRDSEGFFYIVDRKKDMIISGGFNLYPSEIEQVLWKHPAVLDCAVIGVPDPTWGEAIKAVIQLKEGHAEVSAEDLQAHCRAALGGMKTPKSVEIWPSLPRSHIGKVLKREIRERFWQGHERQI